MINLSCPFQRWEGITENLQFLQNNRLKQLLFWYWCAKAKNKTKTKQNILSHIGSSSIQTEIFNIYILDFYHKAMDLGGEKTGVNNMHDEWGEKERNAQCITGSSPVCKLYQKEKLELLYINHVITSDCHEYIVSYLVIFSFCNLIGSRFFKGNNFDLIPSIHRPRFL